MRITEDVLLAVNRAADHYGNVSRLAKAMGIAHSTILFWLSGKTNNISGQLWTNKIRPVLLPFMPPYSQIVLQETPAMYSAGGAMQPSQACHEAPVIDLNDLELFDPAVETLEVFLQKHSDRNHGFFREVRASSFCFSAGEIGDPAFPAASFILASTQHPRSGDVVLAKLREDGARITGKYTRQGNIAMILPLTGTGKSFEWDCLKQQDYLLWILPLIELNMDLSAQA